MPFFQLIFLAFKCSVAKYSISLCEEITPFELVVLVDVSKFCTLRSHEQLFLIHQFYPTYSFIISQIRGPDLSLQKRESPCLKNEIF